MSQNQQFIRITLALIFIVTPSNADLELLQVNTSHIGWTLNTAELELLIVCDKDFSEQRFGNDYQKIIDYWAVYMIDIGMRFRTLKSADVSFRVTSLIAINDTKDQPFIEDSRHGNANSIVLESVYYRFGEWVDLHRSEFAGFDVALLVTAANLDENDPTAWVSYQWSHSACRDFNGYGEDTSSIVLHSKGTWGYDCTALAQSLAIVLGAQDDQDTACVDDQHLMSYGPCDDKQYYFSSCSDFGIANFVQTFEASCLRFADAPGVDVLKLLTSIRPPSIGDQCKHLTNKTDAIPSKFQDEDQCVVINCTVWNGNTLLYNETIYSLDSSPCGTQPDMICFRGQCTPEGQLIRNARSKKCLPSKNKLIYTGQKLLPITVDCQDSNTPLDRIWISFHEEIGFLVVSPNPGDRNFSCLSIENDETDVLAFQSCSETDITLLGWDILETEYTNEFIFYHQLKNSCLRVHVDGTFRLDEKCEQENAYFRWTFYENFVPVSPRISNINYFVEHVEAEHYQMGLILEAVSCFIFMFSVYFLRLFFTQ